MQRFALSVVAVLSFGISSNLLLDNQLSSRGNWRDWKRLTLAILQNIFSGIETLLGLV